MVLERLLIFTAFFLTAILPVSAQEKSSLYIDTLNEVDISKGNIPVYMNVDAKKVEVSTLKENLVNQIDSSVLFNQQIEYVNKDIDPDLWCHIGPGNVTAGMVRKSISYKDLKVINSLESSK